MFAFPCLIKAHAYLRCSACASDMCQCYCSYYTFVLWCLVGYCEPLPEMVKGVMLRARDCSAGPIDFTQTWVDGTPRRGRLMLGGHPEMDESHYVCGPTAALYFY